jgi:hypothetical protein
MSALNEAAHSGLRKILGNLSLAKAILGINAAGAATVKTTNALAYNIDGVQYAKAALAAQSLAVTHDTFGQPVSAAGTGGPNLSAYVQPINTTAYYLLCVNAAGQIAVVQGSYAGQVMQYQDLQRQLTGTGFVPQVEPAGYVAFGIVKVATNGAATFTPGVTLLDAAGVTATYFDVANIPSNLQP